MVGALAEQIDRDDAARLQPEPLGGRNAALERGGIDVECRFVDIDEHRRRAGQRDRLAGRAERKATDTAPHRRGPTPLAISTMTSASVPLAQATTCLAPQKAASAASSAVTSGPLMNWQCVEHARHRLVDRTCQAGGAARRYR